MDKLIHQLVPGSDNSIPYNLKVHQIIREPMNVLVPERIVQLQNNILKVSPDVLIESMDLAILTKSPFNFWDGKLYKPWILKAGTKVSLVLDNNTNALHLVCEIIPEEAGKRISSVATRFSTFEISKTQQTSISFNDTVLLHRIIFYDLFQYDVGNNYWRPQTYDWNNVAGSPAWIPVVNALTTQRWLEQTISTNIKLNEREPYQLTDEYRKSQMMSAAGETNIVVVDGVLTNSDSLLVTLTLDNTIVWDRFKFYALCEYSLLGGVQ